MFLYLSAMDRYHQYLPITVSDFETEQWQHPIHKHNHYELIYIKNGNGIHYINQVPNLYTTGAVYLLGPEDDHYFDISNKTHFVYLKFTDPYIYKEEGITSVQFQKLEYLIKSRETHLDGFQLSAADQKTTAQLFNLVIALKQDMEYNEQLLWLQVLALAVILQRNMPELKTVAGRGKDMQSVFCYLHKHIYLPEKLRSSIIAAHFNTTSDYIGPYFKRNTGVTLRDYIQDYRGALINQRISGGRYSLKEIAAEFGLADESHVSKIIKKVKNKIGK